jgi:hypothetical protein
VLDERHDFDLTEVVEQLVEFVLVLAVEDEVCSKDKDSCCEDRENFQTFET